MARRALLIGWLTAIGPPGCGGEAPTATPGCDASLSWEAVGAPFVHTWCTPCHAPGLQGPARFGAPEGLDLQTLAQVRAVADRIRATALSDAPTMPPSGPAPAEERARVAAWLDCGAPGDTTPAPAPACDGPVLDGDRVASRDPGPCPDHARLAGDLVVDVPLDASWDCVCELSGTLWAEAPEVSLPALTTAGALQGAGALQRLELPALATVGGEVVLQGAELSEVALPLLARAGALTVSDAPGLSELGLHRLEVVEGPVALAELPALSFLQPLDALVEVQGTLQLSGLGITAPPLLRRLVRVRGDLILAQHPDWHTLDGLDALTQVDGALQILDNPALQRLDGLPGPAQIDGGIQIEGNEALSEAEIAAFLARLSGG